MTTRGDIVSIRDLVVGAYRVAAMEHYTDSGEVGRPYGNPPLGFAFYSTEGYTSTILMRPDRVNFAGGDVLGGETSEKVAAFETAAAFAGRWELVDDTIVHRLEAATYPNWVGTTQVRPFEVDEDGLTLYPPDMLMGGEIRHAMVRFARIR
ncbi:MAG TPA: lipocalin-like domain-containing protein [Acidimicrobiia bacterium]|nr:lipocalin-like domain-containing protein [Acidimicrobiia bacterium]